MVFAADNESSAFRVGSTAPPPVPMGRAVFVKRITIQVKILFTSYSSDEFAYRNRTLLIIRMVFIRAT